MLLHLNVQLPPAIGMAELPRPTQYVLTCGWCTLVRGHLLVRGTRLRTRVNFTGSSRPRPANTPTCDLTHETYDMYDETCFKVRSTLIGRVYTPQTVYGIQQLLGWVGISCID